MTAAEFLQRLGQLPLHFHPGTAWDYGFDFDVLGLAIEAVTEQSLGTFLQQRLFEPLSMAPSEQLAVVFMAHAPGPVRFQFRQLLHALVLQALE
jgi:hypothetical protein